MSACFYQTKTNEKHDPGFWGRRPWFPGRFRLVFFFFVPGRGNQCKFYSSAFFKSSRSGDEEHAANISTNGGAECLLSRCLFPPLIAPIDLRGLTCPPPPSYVSLGSERAAARSVLPSVVGTDASIAPTGSASCTIKTIHGHTKTEHQTWTTNSATNGKVRSSDGEAPH